jgi:SRSO17 transposase
LRAAPRPKERLLIEWPEGKDEPSKYWFSALSAETPIATLVDTAKLRWRIERDYLELKQEIGDWARGFRRARCAATPCIAAYGFLTSERGDDSPSAAAA